MMPSGRFPFTVGRLARIHLLFVVLATIAFTLAAGFLRIYFDYRKDLERADETFSMIERSYVPPVSASLFEFDTPQLELLAEGISLLPRIARVEVVEEIGGAKRTVHAVGRAPEGFSRSHSFPLTYTYRGEERFLGSLRVSLDRKALYREVRERTAVTLAATGLQALGMALLVLVIVQLFTVKPLNRIAAHLKEVDLSRSAAAEPMDLGRGDRWHRGDEIGDIVGAVNGMEERLRGSYLSLAQHRDELKRSVEEKEALLRELYHRTKNTLQVIRSMLSLRAGPSLGEGAAGDAVQPPVQAAVQAAVQDLAAEMDARILAMALVHQKLYESEDLSRINIREYLAELTQEVIGTFGGGPDTVGFAIDAEDITLVIDTAIPCGLVVSELLSNSMKHAFPAEGPDTISIFLRRREDGRIVLRYWDNGRGVPPGFDFRVQQGLGMQMVVQVAEQQMMGRVELIRRDGGLGFEIEFPEIACGPGGIVD